jgi:hypothetical protein
MKLDAKIDVVPIGTYAGDGKHGLTKLEYTAIEFMEEMIPHLDSAAVRDIEYAAQQAVKAARILARVLDAEEGR